MLKFSSYKLCAIFSTFCFSFKSNLTKFKEKMEFKMYTITGTQWHVHKMKMKKLYLLSIIAYYCGPEESSLTAKITH